MRSKHLRGKWGVTLVLVLALAALAACKPAHRLHTDEVLDAGQEKRSANGAYVLRMQTDGNAVLRTATGTALWTSKTAGSHGARMVMRERGDLIVQASGGQVLWSTHTTQVGSVTDLGDDGNLVLWGPSRQPLWASGTSTVDATRLPASQRSVSSHQKVFTKVYEGYSGADAYTDRYGHCTVGYGHLIRLGPCTSADLATEWDPDDVFDADVVEHERRLKSSLGSVPMSQREYDALFDYVYNRGSITATSSPSLYAALSSVPPQYAQVGPILRANGDASQVGLCSRRYDEAALFEGGRYDRGYHC